MDFEKELALLAERYRAEGYQVTVRPRGPQVPEFAAAFQPDLLATKGAENVLVQVKENAEALKKDADVSRMAETVNAQPGWRFDLVVLNGTPDGEIVAEEAVEPPVENILRRLDAAERAARAGEEAGGFLLAWGALEAAMRRAARSAGIKGGKVSPLFYLGSLYSNGILEREEYDELNRHLRARNAMVHGLEVPRIDAAMALYVAGAARKLLACDAQE
jgi:hypothetical protein